MNPRRPPPTLPAPTHLAGKAFVLEVLPFCILVRQRLVGVVAFYTCSHEVEGSPLDTDGLQREGRGGGRGRRTRCLEVKREGRHTRSHEVKHSSLDTR